MRILPVNIEKYENSIDYLKQFLPNQLAYHCVLSKFSNEKLSTSSPIQNDKENPSTPTFIQNDFVEEWLSLVKETHQKPSPLLGLRFIQLINFGSLNGWHRPDQLNAIQKIIDINKIFKEEDRETLTLLIKHITHEISSSLPYYPARFNYILDEYCRQHFDNLKHQPSDITKLPKNYWKTHTITLTPSATSSENSNTQRGSMRRQKATKSRNNRYTRQRTILPDQRTISPDQIQNALNSELSQEQMTPNNLARICKKIKKITDNPTLFKNKSFSFITPKKMDTTSEKINRFFCELKLSEDENSIELFIINQNLPSITKGAYKKTNKAHQFSIPLSLDEHNRRNIKCINQIVLTLLPPKESETSSSTHHENDAASKSDSCIESEEDDGYTCLQDSYEVVERLKAYFPDLEFIDRRYILNKSNLFLELNSSSVKEVVEPWLNCNLYEALEKMSIPLDFTETPEFKKITLPDFVSWLIEITNYCKKAHSIGLVHRDCKSENILLWNKEEQIKPYLTDWDLATGIGDHSKPSTFFYWDFPASLGWILPSTDWVILSRTLGNIMLPWFHLLHTKSAKFNKEQLTESKLRTQFIKRMILFQCEELIKKEIVPRKTLEKMIKKENPLLLVTNHLKELLKEEKHHTNLIKEAALKTLAAHLTLGILDKTFQMEEKVQDYFLANGTKTFKEGSLHDKLTFIERMSIKIPLIKTYPTLLEEMKKSLDTFVNEMDEAIAAPSTA